MELQRPRELGKLIVVGGPGKSGSTTIAKMLARKYSLSYVYGGQLMTKIANGKGYERIEDFLENTPQNELEKYDKEVDKQLIKMSFIKDVLIDSKIFAGLCWKYKIPTTVKIWLDCNIDTRVEGKYGKDGGNKEEIKKELLERYEIDKNRFTKEYGIDYTSPKKYNDIVLDTSNMNVPTTFNIIIKLIEDGKYIKQ